MRDPYSVLGIAKTATASDIKRAFRKLAKQYHPDQNTSDPSARERFSEASQAYEILGDEQKRAQFDRGEIDASGKPVFQSQGFDPHSDFDQFRHSASSAGGGRGGGAFDDILNDILGGLGGGRRRASAGAGFAGQQHQSRTTGRPKPGQDAQVVARVTLENLAHEGKARVTLPTGKVVDVNLPAGTVEGEKIRLRAQGFPGEHGGPAGDAIVEIRFVPHPVFTPDDDDLRLDLPLTLYEAVLGDKIKVPTLDGPVNLSIPAKSSGGRVMRLKGKGLPNKSGGHGDLLVTLRIMLPENHDQDLENLMKEWKKTKPYRPRGIEYN